jgi:uncharacterized membrane protein YkoI
MRIMIAALALTMLGGAALASPTHYVGQEFVGHAKVTMAAARAIALKARPGKMTDAELEKEDGGSGLRYSFDIKARGHTFEVGVDAMTGAVLENKKEGKNPD